ncbi:MAG: hypothetical protein WCD70_10125 [Alphaproteobacteria bacterium]
MSNETKPDAKFSESASVLMIEALAHGDVQLMVKCLQDTEMSGAEFKAAANKLSQEHGLPFMTPRTMAAMAAVVEEGPLPPATGRVAAILAAAKIS